MKIVIEDGAFLPTRAHPDDAGLDLYSPCDAYLIHGSSCLIDTGVRVQIPKGYYGKLESKSGLMTRNDVVTAGGVIDSGYTGTIKVPMHNYSPSTDYWIRRGDKITQMVIVPIVTPELELVGSLEDTERGEKGFGSSGK